MKKLFTLTLALAFVLFFNNSFSQWVKTEGPYGAYVQSLERVGNQIWAGANVGLYTSADEGFSWEKSLEHTKSCYDIFCFGDTVVLITVEYVSEAYGDVAFKSRTSFDNGLTWQAEVLISNTAYYGYFNAVHVQTTIVMDCWLEKFVSHDFGNTWTSISNISGQEIEYFYSGGSTIVASTYNTMHTNYLYYLSTDMAETWNLIAEVYSGSSIFVKDSLILIVSRYQDTLDHCFILRKDYPDVEWDTVYSSSYGTTFHHISEFENIKYATDYATTIASYDNGLTWEEVPLPKTYALADTVTTPDGFVESNIIWGIKRYDYLQDTIYYSNTGMKDLDAYGIKENNGKLFVRKSDHIMVSDDGGMVWKTINYPTSNINQHLYGYFLNSDTIYAISNNLFYKSFDLGETWDTITFPAYLFSGASDGYMAKIENTFYVSGSYQIYKTENFGLTWDTLPSLPLVSSTSPGPYSCSNNYLGTGSVYAANDILFATNSSGVIFRYDEIGQNWISTSCSPGRPRIKSIDGMLVVLDHSCLQISTDNGNSWIDIQAMGLPVIDFSNRYPFEIISINGTWFGSCYDAGIYYSNTQGNSWNPLDSESIPFNPQGDLASLNGILYSGSQYRGVWRRSGVFDEIQGQVFYDINCNGIKDSGEEGLENINVATNPYGIYSSTNSEGNFSIFTDALGDTLRPYLSSAYCSSIPEYYINTGASTNYNFGICVTSDIQDVSIDLTNISVFNPGFNTTLHLSAVNRGSVSMSPVVELVIDNQLDFISSVPYPNEINGDTLIWNIPTLENFMDFFDIFIDVQTSTSSLMGDSINCYSKINPIYGDANPVDNFDNLHEIVVASYDPNDKACSEGNYFSTEQVEEGIEIEYTIRFQNTGTFPTSFVHIIDTLSNFLNPSTFRVISASHPLTYSMYGAGIVDFYFEDLVLPDSSTNELESHGYVKYGIKCKESVSVGNAVTNTAYIFFDYNPPIVTNTTSTAICTPILLTLPEEENTNIVSFYAFVFPNPATDIINVNLEILPEQGLMLEIFSISGELIEIFNITGKTNSFSIERLKPGLYIGNFRNPNNETNGSFKLIVQ
ncbi:MAG: T9SS type A sorting domain-containing protein [Bacteroidales bacterium]|nr:T9SS type A sorting domain-containing protein [Bacteroidales bacterium]